MRMRWTMALLIAAVTTAFALEAAAQAPAAPRAADCTACARNCTGRCEAQPGGCVCKEAAQQRTNVGDCYAACARQGGANAAALEECRAACRAQIGP